MKKLIVRDFFQAIVCKLLAITKLKKKVFYWIRRIKLGCHASVVCGKVLGGDCSVFIPEVFEELDSSAATKFCDWVFESDDIFFRAVICNHRDNDDLKFTEGTVFFTQYVVSTDALSCMGSRESSCIR